MESKKFTVNLAKMKSVFGFPIGGECVRPKGYNANRDWEDLTGFGIWDSSGMPAGYITDLALSIVHKFIAYNVYEKERTNKMKTRPASHASFCHIITGLAHSFEVISSTKGGHDGYEEIEPDHIDYSELKGAQIISDGVTIVPSAKRHCVEKFINKEIVQGRRVRVLDMDVGSSNPMDEDEYEEGEGEGEDEDGQDKQPIPNDIHSQFSSSMNHFDTCFTSLTNDIHSQFSSLRNDVKARFDAQDQ
ncbi:hypothetical protein OROGR_014901 [Orobanche gracilis]